MKPVRLHLASTTTSTKRWPTRASNLGQGKSCSMRGSSAKVARPCDGTRQSANCAKISAQEYVCIASRRAESTRRMVTSTECTRTAPSTSRASFISPDTFRTSPKGRSKERVRGTTRIAQQPLHDHCRQARTYKRETAESAFANSTVSFFVARGRFVRCTTRFLRLSAFGLQPERSSVV